MKSIFSFIILMLFTISAFAIPIKRQFQDMKLVTQKLIEYQLISDPAAAGTTDVLNDDDGPTSASAISVSTFAAQPDVPRNLVMTPTGTTADVAACTITVNGTDFHNQVISEDFTFAENASTSNIGSKAFKSVTSVSFPASCEDSPFSATWAIGYGEKLGLKRCLDQAGHVVMSTSGGAKESTEPTVVADSSNIEGNTADFNGTMDGSNDFEIFFFQNFQDSCFP